MLGRRCVDGNPNLKHPLAPGEHKAKSLARVAGKTHLHPTGTELGARAGVGEADMSEEIKREGIKGQIRELRGQFHQTPALTEPVRADDDRGQTLSKGLESWEEVMSLSWTLRGSWPRWKPPWGVPSMEQAGLGATVLPDLCPLPEIIPAKYHSSECPWIVL